MTVTRPNHPNLGKRSFFTLLILCFASPRLGAQESVSLTPQDIDHRVKSVWQSQQVEPVGHSSDSEFLRRIYFDLTGTPPSYQKSQEFLASTEPLKRNKLIDALIASESYGIHRSNLLMNEIVEGRILKQRLPQESFENFFETSFNEDKPYDRLVRELIVASGKSSDNGATYLMVTHQANPEDLTGTVSRLFNGTQLRCVQCHDDKFGDWKQTDFWGTAAFFVRTEIRPSEKMGNRLVSVEVLDRKKGEAVIPEGGITPNVRDLPKEERQKARRDMLLAERRQSIPPSFLGKPVELEPEENRREILAALVTSPKNKLFARATVNRVWAEMFGKGLIEPIDDVYGKDAGEWEPLLQDLSEEFVRSGHSLKNLYRLVANTETYQLTSEGEEGSEDLLTCFARSRMRAHSPEVLLNAILRTTHADEEMRKREEKMGGKGPRNRILEKFTFAFGNDEGNRVLSFEATIPQALMMMNDPLIEKALAPFPGSVLMEIGQETRDPEERVRLLYLSALSREPSRGEMTDALDYLRENLGESSEPLLVADAGDNRRRRNGKGSQDLKREVEPYQDLLWALMNTSEFLYNH